MPDDDRLRFMWFAVQVLNECQTIADECRQIDCSKCKTTDNIESHKSRRQRATDKRQPTTCCLAKGNFKYSFNSIKQWRRAAKIRRKWNEGEKNEAHNRCTVTAARRRLIHGCEWIFRRVESCKNLSLPLSYGRAFNFHRFLIVGIPTIIL